LPTAADQDIVSGSPVEDIFRAPPVEPISPAGAGNEVTALPTGENVPAGAAAQMVVPTTTDDALDVQLVPATSARDCGPSSQVDDDGRAKALVVRQVEACVAEEPVVTAPSEQLVGPAPSTEGVGAATTDQPVVAAEADQHIVSPEPEDEVAPSRAAQDVRSWRSDDDATGRGPSGVCLR
jgi:hypothetical protein